MATNRYQGVYKRGQTWSYRAQFLNNGERWGVSGSNFTSARDAWDARNKALDDAKRTRGRPARPDAAVTLGDYLLSWLLSHAPSVRISSSSSYKSRIETMTRTPCAKRRLKDLTESDYRRLVADMQQTSSDETVKGKLSTLRTALDAAVRDGLLPSNPVADIRVARTTERFRADAWDAETARRFLAHRRQVSDPLYLTWHLAIVTGLRKGELHGLKRADIDLNARMLYVRRQRSQVRSQIVEGPPKTDGSEAAVHLDQETCDLLAKHVWTCDYLVTNEKTGQPFGNMIRFDDRWKKACQEAGVRQMRFHDLRRTTATLLAEDGVPLVYAQARLRHWSQAMTAHYTQIQNSTASDVAERLGSLLRGPAA